MQKALFAIAETGWVVTGVGSVAVEGGELLFQLSAGAYAEKSLQGPIAGAQVRLASNQTAGDGFSLRVGSTEVTFVAMSSPVTHIIGAVTAPATGKVRVTALAEPLVLSVSECIQVVPELSDVYNALEAKLTGIEVQDETGTVVPVGVKYGLLGLETVKMVLPAVTIRFLAAGEKEDKCGYGAVRDGRSLTDVLYYEGMPFGIDLQVDAWAHTQTQFATLLVEVAKRLRRADWLHFWAADHDLDLERVDYVGDDRVPFRQVWRGKIDLVGFESFVATKFVKTVVIEEEPEWRVT